MPSVEPGAGPFLLEMPPEVASALRRLRQAGFEAYAVGGCVRDALLGLPPHDWDIAASAPPAETARLFAEFRQVHAGLAHGTVTVLFGETPVEITTFRVDGAYSDGRRPDRVSFTPSIREDLARRDFTINACAATGETLIDPFGGCADARARTLRCVGDPETRFHEDALRILRGVRFAATLGFSAEERTARAMHGCLELLCRVSAERVAQELRRALAGAYVRPAFLEFSDVIAAVLPELGPSMGFSQHSRFHIYDVYEHSLAAVEAAPENDLLLRTALLLHDAAKPQCFSQDALGEGHFTGHAASSAETAQEALRRLKRPNTEIARVSALIRHHDDPLTPAPSCARRLLARLGPEDARRLLAMRRADLLAQNPALAPDRLCSLAQAEAALDAALRARSPLSLRDLAVNGRDLLALGVPQGPRMGALLRRLYGMVLDGALENRRAPLLDAARRLAGLP